MIHFRVCEIVPLIRHCATVYLLHADGVSSVCPLTEIFAYVHLHVRTYVRFSLSLCQCVCVALIGVLILKSAESAVAPPSLPPPHGSELAAKKLLYTNLLISPAARSVLRPVRRDFRTGRCAGADCCTFRFANIFPRWEISTSSSAAMPGRGRGDFNIIGRGYNLSFSRTAQRYLCARPCHFPTNLSCLFTERNL